MDILIFAKTFYPNIGGMEVSTRIMAKELVRFGFSVTVVTGTLRNTDSELEEGYQVVRSNSFTKLLRLAGEAGCIIVRGGISAAMGLAALLRGRPIICFHEMANPLPSPWSYFPYKPAKALTDAIRKHILHQARFHIGVSHSVLEEKKMLPNIKTSVLYNPVASNLWTEAPLPKEQRDIDLLFVGRIRESKGVFIFAEALEQVASQTNIPRTVFAGAGPDLSNLKKRLEKLESHKIEFWGEQKHETLSQLYARSRWLIVPSTTLPEGMGMVAAEALAHGTPVIASDQAPLMEVIGKGGVTYPKSDSVALANTLQEVLTDSDCWNKMSEQAWQERDRFSLKAYQDTLKSWITLGVFSQHEIPKEILS